MSSKPTLVLVPGAWHRADTWSKVVAELEPQGYKTICITHPSTLSDPNKGIFDDIEATRKAILEETSQGRDVVVVVHSYGGMVGPSAIKGLTDPMSERPGHVIGLVLMATGFCVTGVGFLEGIGGSPPPFWNTETDPGFATLIVDTRELFYHDLPEEEGKYWVSRLLKQALKPLTDSGEHVYSGWKDVPAWYLVPTDDRTFPTEAQMAMADRAKEQGGNIVVEKIHTSHSPMLSKPKETAKFITRAAEAFTR